MLKNYYLLGDPVCEENGKRAHDNKDRTEIIWDCKLNLPFDLELKEKIEMDDEAHPDAQKMHCN